jgi:hypothetical protein
VLGKYVNGARRSFLFIWAKEIPLSSQALPFTDRMGSMWTITISDLPINEFHSNKAIKRMKT